MSLFEKVNIPDCLVIIGLVTALIMAIFYNLNELPCPSHPACLAISAVP